MLAVDPQRINWNYSAPKDPIAPELDISASVTTPET